MHGKPAEVIEASGVWLSEPGCCILNDLEQFGQLGGESDIQRVSLD